MIFKALFLSPTDYLRGLMNGTKQAIKAKDIIQLNVPRFPEVKLLK